MHSEFCISTNRSPINTDFIHDYMTKTSCWGKERTIEQTIKIIENSFCFGMYTRSNKQIGFARLVTEVVFLEIVLT